MKKLTAFILLLLFATPLMSQEYDEGYSITPAPDLWYNDVDGVRIGLRVLGEMEGAFKDGPHRLDAGIWFGTKFPANPVSYYFSFTEPIKSISDFGEEASIQTISSIRTGLSSHSLLLNKRWQDGFNELKHTEVSISFTQEKMFNPEYRPYQNLWQTNWKSLLALDFLYHNEIEDENIFEVQFNVKQNLNNDSQTFTVFDMEVWNQKRINSDFSLGLRTYFGSASDNAAPEYLYTASYAQPYKWLNNGVSRAEGTILTSLLDNGIAQVSGGANLRGYTDTGFSNLSVGGFNSVIAVNSEIEFPNPINNALKKGIIGDFVFLKSYIFMDAGTVFESNPLLFDAGVGLQFSMNIPDFLGKPRGLALRYEIPFWISKPDAGDSNFAFRNLIGFGAVISL